RRPDPDRRARGRRPGRALRGPADPDLDGRQRLPRPGAERAAQHGGGVRRHRQGSQRGAVRRRGELGRRRDGRPAPPDRARAGDAGGSVRAAAEGGREEERERDVQRLQAQWYDIARKAKAVHSPNLLYGEPDLAIRVVRDIFNEDFARLIVSGDEAWDTLQGY